MPTLRESNRDKMREWRLKNPERNRESGTASKAAWRKRNSERTRATNRRYYWNDREAYRLGRIRRQYGLSAEQYADLLTLQENRCAICRSPEPGPSSWHVDHDHGCCETKKRSCGKCIRGLLCNNCNLGLGHFKHDAGRLVGAAEYVKRFAKPQLRVVVGVGHASSSSD